MRAIFTFLGLTPKDEICSPLGKGAFALRNFSWGELGVGPSKLPSDLRGVSSAADLMVSSLPHLHLHAA